MLVVGPIFLASQGSPHPITDPTRAVLANLLLAGVTYFALVVVSMGAAALGFGSFRMLIQFIWFFTTLTCFVLPLVQHSELVESAHTRLNVINLAVSIVTAFVLVMVAQRHRREMNLLAVIFIIGNFVLIAVLYGIDDSESPIEPLVLSADQNVIVLSFDGLSGSLMEQAMISEPSLARALDGFVVYPKVISTSPATAASIAAELRGNTNFKLWGDTADEVWEADPGALLTNVLARRGYDVTTYGVYSKEFTEGTPIRPSRSRASDVEILNLSIARTLTPAFVLTGAVEDGVGEIHEGLATWTSEGSELLRQMSNSQTPAWDRDLAASYLDFEWIRQGMVVGDKPPVGVFLHFTHTHYPVKWDATCDFRADEERWYSTNQTSSGVLEESKCALRQFAAFVGRLRALGVLDNSMVVLKSDHGEPTPYAPAGGIESVPINGHPMWGMSRYAPFLAIKPIGSSGDRWVRDTSPVLIDDLARTVCVSAQIDYDCSQFPGYDIVREGSQIDIESEVTAFVVGSDEADHRFSTHIPVQFTRGSDPLRSLHQALIREGLADPVTITTGG